MSASTCSSILSRSCTGSCRAFYDEIAQALEKLYGVPADSLELPTILHFGSWVGGDMDGNPDVHAKSIRETLARQQQMIVNTYFGECQTLVQQLSQSASRISVSPALSARIDDYMTLLPSARTSVSSRHDRMPYRVFLAQIGERLRHTYAGRANGYEQPRQFRADVQLIADSLNANKGAHAGLFFVRRLLRRIDTFGFHIATLDVRQHTEPASPDAGARTRRPALARAAARGAPSAPRRRVGGRRRPARRARCARQEKPVGV